MDEHAFRQRLAELRERSCPYAKALLSACVACGKAERVQIAEREVIACGGRESQQRCVELHRLLRRNFSFALGVRDENVPLTHGQEMRVQCGGLRGLSAVLHDRAEVEDVALLLQQAVQHWGGLGELPYSAIVQAARRSYRGRHG